MGFMFQEQPRLSISFHSSLKDDLEFDLAGKVALRSVYRNQG